MSDRNESKRTVERRDVIKGAAVGLVVATGMHPLVHSAGTHTAGRDLIQRENGKPGTRDWLLTKTRTVPGKQPYEGSRARCSMTRNFELNMGPVGALLMGARLDDRGNSGGRGSGDWTCAMPEHWLFNGTGMKKGDSIKGLVGWEWHGAPATNLPGMNIVAEGTPFINGKEMGRYTSTIYDGPQDNVVSNAATIWWANGLSSPPGHVNPSRHGITQQGVDERVQQITHNLFGRIIA